MPAKKRKCVSVEIDIFSLPQIMRVPKFVRVVGARTEHSGGNPTRVPAIHLSGAWLEAVGFPAGARFMVIAEPNRQLILSTFEERATNRTRR